VEKETKEKMASLSDAMYFTNAYQMRGDLNKPLQMPAISDAYSGRGMATCPVPEGMEQQSVWSTWRTGGSDRTPANYPCSNNGAVCPSTGANLEDCKNSPTVECPAGCDQACGRSLVLRENSIWGDQTGSADGTGYVTTNWLPPSVPKVRLGFCWISRKVVPVISRDKLPAGAKAKPNSPIVQGDDGQAYLFDDEHAPGSVSQLFLDNKPLLRYWNGVPFLFKSEQTPFVYMVPNAIWVKTGGAKYRLDIMSADERGEGCGCGGVGMCADCLGY
jgi:hypothetical protein